MIKTINNQSIKIQFPLQYKSYDFIKNFKGFKDSKDSKDFKEEFKNRTFTQYN